MKTLSIRQPWAWLIVRPDITDRARMIAGRDFKDIENRDWRLPAKYALPFRFIVHASQRFDQEGYEWAQETFPEIFMPREFDRGGIIGTVEIINCVSCSKSRWFCGEWGFVLRDPQVLRFVPWKGRLGFFDVPDRAIQSP